MVPRISRGKNFKGAGLYFLHDKDHASTSNRIAFTHTRNLPTNDPHAAIKVMAFTAINQNAIKKQAGVPLTGNKLKKPVYHYSLAWHPEQSPTQSDMIEAATETLSVFGLEDREVLFVAHNDSDHSHLHIIANLVSPETGKIPKELSFDRLKASTWAEKYEVRNGKIYCKERVINNELRKNNEFVRDTKSEIKAEYHRWRKHSKNKELKKQQSKELSLDPEPKKTSVFQEPGKATPESGTMARKHEQQKKDISQANDKRIELAKISQKVEDREKWTEFFKTKRAEEANFEEKQDNAVSRLKFYTEKRNNRFDGSQMDRRGVLSPVAKSVFSNNEDRKNLEKKHTLEKKQLSSKMSAEAKTAHEKISSEHKKQLEGLEARQTQELSEYAARDPRGNFEKASKPEKKPSVFQERGKAIEEPQAAPKSETMAQRHERQQKELYAAKEARIEEAKKERINGTKEQRQEIIREKFRDINKDHKQQLEALKNSQIEEFSGYISSDPEKNFKEAAKPEKKPSVFQERGKTSERQDQQPKELKRDFKNSFFKEPGKHAVNDNSKEISQPEKKPSVFQERGKRTVEPEGIKPDTHENAPSVFQERKSDLEEDKSRSGGLSSGFSNAKDKDAGIERGGKGFGRNFRKLSRNEPIF